MVKYPNQKTVCINRDIPKQTKDNKKPYMVVYNDSIFNAAKAIHKPSTFKLYLYLVRNQDKYTFALSTKDFSEECGVSADSAKDAVNDLIALGYLVDRGKHHYDFYEEPIQEELLEIEEERRSFPTKSGNVLELTFSELLKYVKDEEKAKEKWRSAQ